MGTVADFIQRLEDEDRPEAAERIRQMQHDVLELAIAIDTDQPTWSDDLVIMVASVSAAAICDADKEHHPK